MSSEELGCWLEALVSCPEETDESTGKRQSWTDRTKDRSDKGELLKFMMCNVLEPVQVWGQSVCV